jgi:rhamnosyl/mannosyltransferase
VRIVHIYKDYFPILGGIENHIRQLAEAQVARGHDVAVLVTSLNSKYALETLNGVRVTKAPRHLNVQSAPISLDFPNAARRLTSTADIAHVHSPYPAGEACNLLYGHARKTVITWHSDVVRQQTLLRFYAPILRRVIARADRILPTSEMYARTSPWLRDHLNKCTVVPLGVDVSRFSLGRREQERKRRGEELRQTLLSSFHPFTPSPFLLLSVGRLRYYKGLDDLIRAMPHLPDVVTVLVGIGPMEAEWKALARQIGVADRVIFAGEVSDADLLSYYHAADAYVIPANSRAEAFGIAILEAMASGLPVISTEVGTATSWVNQHGVTGLVTPPHSPDAIAQAVRQLRDEVLRERMGKAGRARVLAEFTLQRMVERVEDVYRSLLSTADEHEAAAPLCRPRRDR